MFPKFRAQTISHQELIIPSGKNGSWNVDKYGDPAVIEVAESFASKENRGYDSCSQVTGQARADGDVGKSPDHGRVSQTNREGSADRRNEWVGWIEIGPNYETDEAVDKELGEEEVAQLPVVKCQFL